MKCPKCAYLGFETGDRCKNCGYDFSLMATPADDRVGNLALHGEADALTSTPAAAALAFEPTLPPPSFRGAPALPLFGSAAPDDEPLIRVPATPRAPLSVRKTPETPRLRAAAKAVEQPAPVLALDFTDEAAAPAAAPDRPATRTSSPAALEASGAGARILAAVLDHAILLAIDAVVIYLTLRVAQLTPADWQALPLLPLLTFLALVKLSYFTAFTCIGGQTIGKMATGIRVVSDDRRPIDPPHAIHRALAGAVTVVTLGAGFVPALVGGDRRALHDRLAHTRVVNVPAA